MSGYRLAPSTPTTLTVTATVAAIPQPSEAETARTLTSAMVLASSEVRGITPGIAVVPTDALFTATTATVTVKKANSNPTSAETSVLMTIKFGAKTVDTIAGTISVDYTSAYANGGVGPIGTIILGG